MSNDDDDKTGGGGKREKRRRNKGGDHYDVGYCKPPVEHRWERGYCPNRNGRPKNIPITPETNGEILARILAEKVSRPDGRKMTFLEFGYRSIIKAAIVKGNIKAFQEIMKMIPSNEPPDDGIDHLANIRKKLEDLAERNEERRTWERVEERVSEEELHKKIEEELKDKTL